MGIKRVVDTNLWQDTMVDELFSPEDKYFWLFLLTNPFTKQLGIYRITPKQIAYFMGYNLDSVKVLMDRFENQYGIIKYADGEIAIKNYLRYSIVSGGKPVEDCIKRDMALVENKDLIGWVFDSLSQYDDLNVTVSKIISEYINNNPINSNSLNSINDNDNDNENDESYNESYHESSTNRTTNRPPRFVKPSLEEVKAYIEERCLDMDAEAFYDYYESNGWMVGKSKMRDWKAAVRNWARRDKKKKGAFDEWNEI